MNHQKISAIENAFRLGQRTELTFKKFSLKVPNESTPLDIIACRPKENYSSYYYLTETPKEKSDASSVKPKPKLVFTIVVGSTRIPKEKFIEPFIESLVEKL
mgnify:CR=1 FL=1